MVVTSGTCYVCFFFMSLSTYIVIFGWFTMKRIIPFDSCFVKVIADCCLIITWVIVVNRALLLPRRENTEECHGIWQKSADVHFRLPNGLVSVNIKPKRCYLNLKFRRLHTY